MGYNIYCYKSQQGIFSIEEAKSIIKGDVTEHTLQSTAIKLEIVELLLAYDPHLQILERDFDKIAADDGISQAEAEADYDCIELYSTNKKMATQITIFHGLVTIIIPYWYTNNKVEKLFDRIDEYLKIISQATGYFVYDPQSKIIFDPLIDPVSSRYTYIEIIGGMELLRDRRHSITGKSWWKFW